MLKRQTKTGTLDCAQDILDGRTLTEAITVLQALQKKYEENTNYTKIYFDIDYDYGYDGHPRLLIRCDREETDKEYALRTEREDGDKVRQTVRDRTEYERLKGMFEGKKC
jgi:hypothetical protein